MNHLNHGKKYSSTKNLYNYVEKDDALRTLDRNGVVHSVLKGLNKDNELLFSHAFLHIIKSVLQRYM